MPTFIHTPNISEDHESTILLEWWHKGRKLSIYVESGEMLKITETGEIEDVVFNADGWRETFNWLIETPTGEPE